MFFRTISISLLGLVAATLLAQVPKPDELPRIAEEVIKERELASKDLDVRSVEPALPEPDYTPYIAGENASLFAHAMSPVRPKDADANAYREAVDSMLRASDPKLVGLACMPNQAHVAVPND